MWIFYFFGSTQQDCILESICVDPLFLWVPDSRFRLLGACTMAAEIDYL